MRLGIISDIHDQVWNLRAALAGLQEADALLCCGDLCSPFIIGLLAEGFPGRPIHIVFGNNDGDLYRIAQNAALHERVQLHGELFVGKFAGRRVLANHYPALADSYDLICYGHDHLRASERHGKRLLLNPGTLLGYEPGGKRDVPATFALYDTATGEATFAQIVAGSGPEGDSREVQPL